MKERTGQEKVLHVGINIMIDFSRAWPHLNDLTIFYSSARRTQPRHTHSQTYTPNELQKQQFLLKVRPWALLATVTLHISGW